ncbi:MAG: transglutaminase domain-containing protein, partial [Candidatus Heimdallarchaeota archaeon]|nr:transglutaminase domain-containing protein [Candidatus Heimdallarchaeota archaeon]
MSSRSRQQRKRGVTQTTTNEYGEVQVRKMVRTKEKRVIPALTLKRMPSNILGLAFGLFAGINYVHNKELLDTELFVEMRAEFIGIYRFLIGSIGVAIATFLSWALLSNGFKFKKYPIAFRQLLSLVFIFYLAMAIMSPFINNPMLRHQDEMNNASSDVDLSRLNSPFYTELLEGLLNLIGNIPNPQELMATIHPGTGEPVFDPSVDRYLWRWLVAEYYDPQKLDFSKGHETFTNTYKATDSTAGLTGATRSFEINQNFFSFTPGYQNEAVTTWNSVEGSLIQNYNNLQAVDVNSSALALANKDGFRDINEQPVLKFNLPASGTEGNLTYNSFWLEEDKDAISQNSILYSDLNSALSSISNDERFGSIASAGGISAVWGLDSLPGGSAYVNNVADGFYFNQRYQQILSTITAETTVYSLVLSISNDISQAVLNGINDGSLVIEAANDTADDAGAPDGVDKAYYFYQQLATGGTYGIKEVLAGFNNMIRAFNIPARPIVGFSVGDVSPEEIVLRMRHLHVWIEALIPRTD